MIVIENRLVNFDTTFLLEINVTDKTDAPRCSLLFLRHPIFFINSGFLQLAVSTIIIVLKMYLLYSKNVYVLRCYYNNSISNLTQLLKTNDCITNF